MFIGRKEIANVWKEEAEWSTSGKLKEIKEIIEIKLNDMLIEITTRENRWYDRYGTYKNNIVEYCVYIPYENEVFSGVDFNDEYFNEDEELLDKISILRSDVEEAIEKYLIENGYLTEEDI